MIAREKALTYLDEGFSLLKDNNLYSSKEEEHYIAIDRTLTNLNNDENAAEIAAAFQALYEAKSLITLKSSIQGERIILGDYFIGIAVKLVLPLRTKSLLNSLCIKMKTIGENISKPSKLNSKQDFFDEIDNMCRSYLEERG